MTLLLIREVPLWNFLLDVGKTASPACSFRWVVRCEVGAFPIVVFLSSPLVTLLTSL